MTKRSNQIQVKPTTPRAARPHARNHIRLPNLVSVALAITLLSIACGGRDMTPPDPGEVEHSIDLTRQIEMANPLVETRRIDFGSAESSAHLLEGWTREEPGENRGTARSTGRSAIRLVVLRPRDIEVVAQIAPERGVCAGNQEISLELNGTPLPTISLGNRMAEHRFTLPAAGCNRGENIVLIHGTCGTAEPRNDVRTRWERMLIGDGETPAQPTARDGALVLPVGTALRYLVELPVFGELSIAGLQSDGQDARLDVTYRLLGYSRDLVARSVQAGESSVSVELPSSLSGWAWLSLTSVSEDDATGGEASITVADPRLGFRAAPGAASALRSPPPWIGSEARRPNVIVYLVDTLRADHLGCYGYPKPVSAAIDDFAAEGVRFANTIAQAAWTRSAVASIFAGTAPPQHGVFNRRDGLREEAVTLAEVLHGAGYETGAFVTSGHISPRWGMTQGFETFSLITDNDMGLRYALSDGVNPPLFEWLDRQAERPFFLYVHTLDPHAPYAPREYAAKAIAPHVSQPKLDKDVMARLQEMEERRAEKLGNPTPVTLGTQVWLTGLKQGIVPVTHKMTEDMEALYDAEIYSNDRSFGELLEHLRSIGAYENSIIFFLSDHGEEFDDHQRWGHGHTLYNELLRVPLIARFPDSSIPRGRAVTQLARQIDISATVADYLDLTPPPSWQGASLLPQAFGSVETGDSRPGYAHLLLDGHFLESLEQGRWKLICDRDAGAGCSLFDLSDDPEERSDVAARHPQVVAELTAKLDILSSEGEQLQSYEADPDEETRLQLEALGYVF